MTAKAAPPAATSIAALTALGVVFGDLGTSPLYTMQTVIGALGQRHDPPAILGVLSLIVWTLILTISLKYCFFVMRADNHGEGGILALMSLVGMNDWRRGTFLFAGMGLLGAALIYGDGVITPAISVLSALEGVTVATSALKPIILPLAVAILLTLFAVQRLGTAAIGRLFGPVMLAWFVAIAALGAPQIVRHPIVLEALNPLMGLRLLVSGGVGPLLILGGVFLCATGGEALYADMGHVGPFPIRLAWYAVALPSLVLSYAGQAARLLEGVPSGQNPFFLLAPAWSVIPLVCLATAATIIASQAIITGAFSMTRQAMQLGWLPAFSIRQTSDKVYGQIYVPAVNIMMGAATLAITLAFKTSDRLAGAYGTAVATTMVLTSLLLLRAMRVTWGWSVFVTGLLGALFLTVDLSFFVANLAKIFDGGWVPLSLGAAIFTLMIIWRTGVQRVRARLADLALPTSVFFETVARNHAARVPGTLIFLTRSNISVPQFMIDYVRNAGALQETVVALHILFDERPRIPDEERCTNAKQEGALWRVTLRYGFVEIPRPLEDLAQAHGLPAEVNLETAVFIVSRDIVDAAHDNPLTRWRREVFAYIFKNGARVTDRFNLPPERTLEISRHIKS